MILNTFKCKYLTTLHFKGLTPIEHFERRFVERTSDKRARADVGERILN